MATGGSWRWQMSSPLGDSAHDLFWQQLLRRLISDTPGHVAASVPAQMLLDNGAVTLTAEVRDRQYTAPDAKVEAHILGPSGVSFTSLWRSPLLAFSPIRACSFT
jgi:hypothetical protein